MPAIYLDHAATTPLDERVFAAMEPYLRGSVGNPASRQHAWGQRAAAAIERARQQIATVLAADPREIVFTSGATEANNLALLGLAASPAYAERRRIVTVRTEHRAVLDPCAALEQRGYEVLRLPVRADGTVDPDAIARALDDRTLVVSAMAANNETGVCHDLAAIADLCRERGVLFHCDATQALGHVTADAWPDADLLSLSAHKVHGPMGVGVLYVRRRGPRVRLKPILHGGGHQRGLRSGTLPVAQIVGLGEACALAHDLAAAEVPRLETLRTELERRLLDAIPGTLIHGRDAPRAAHIANVFLPGTTAEARMQALPELAMATSSACSSATLQPSYVLRAMGLDDSVIAGSLRLSIGRTTTPEDVAAAAAMLASTG